MIIKQSADNWHVVKSLIDSESPASPMLLKLRFYLWEKFHTYPHDQCRLVGKCIFFGDRKLDLRQKPLVLQLFSEYLSYGNTHLSKRELIHKIYLNDRCKNLSHRLEESHDRNIIKLLSRARNLARQAFWYGEGASLEWFAYDPFSNSYFLYRLRSSGY